MLLSNHRAIKWRFLAKMFSWRWCGFEIKGSGQRENVLLLNAIELHL